MENNEKLKEISIKKRTCYYFVDIIKFENFDLDNILIDEEPYKNVLVYNISYKTLIDAKLLRVKFAKIVGFIRAYDGARYLVLFGAEKYDAIYDKIRFYTCKEWD